MSKVELQDKLRTFFDTKNFIEESTDNDNKEVDYSIVFTTAESGTASSHLIDIEIYYLKMRNGNIIITESGILDYID